MCRVRFDGRRVVVTGAGSGFGAAIARRFASEGGRVLLADLNLDSAEAVAADIRADGGIALASAVDVSDESQVEAMIQQAAGEWGGVDVLVNNAGYSHRQKLLWKLSVAEFDAVFSVNVRGVFLGCKHVIPGMIEAGGGDREHRVHWCHRSETGSHPLQWHQGCRVDHVERPGAGSGAS